MVLQEGDYVVISSATMWRIEAAKAAAKYWK